MNAAPGVEGEQVFVAGYYGCCAGGEGEFEIFVVGYVAAVGDDIDWLEPYRGSVQALENCFAAQVGCAAGEFRSVKDLGNFGVNGVGKCYEASCCCGFYGSVRNTVWVQGRRNDRARIYDIDAQPRRSAL